MGKVDLSELAGSKVLLVGGTGFVGSHVLEALVHLNADVTVAALFRPTEYNGPALERCRCLSGPPDAHVEEIGAANWDVVINVGGRTNHGHDAVAHEQSFRDHFWLVRALVTSLRHTPKRFIQVGSALEYGDTPPPHSEGARERPLNPYAAAKVAATHFLLMLNRSRGFPAVVLRPFFVYGPRQREDSFLAWAAAQARLGRTIDMTMGEQTRDPVWVGDVAAAILRAAVLDAAVGQIINVASGAPMRLRDIAQAVVDVVGAGRLNLGAVPYREGEVMRSEADVRRLIGILGLRPRTDFKLLLCDLLESQ